MLSYSSIIVSVKSTNTLEKLGLRENTLIILSSDNDPVVDDGYDDKAEELLNGHSPAGPLRGNKYSAFGRRNPYSCHRQLVCRSKKKE